MSSLNQRALASLNEIKAILQESQNKRGVGRTSVSNVVRKQISAVVEAEAKRRLSASKNDKRNKVKAGHGIRPAILDVLMKSKKELKRAELAELVANRAPRGIAWSLGSCNIALGGLIKDRMVRKEKTHGGKFSITKEG